MSAERELWRLVEPLHAVTYYGEPARAAYVEAGLKGFWRGYFAGRAAPLGPVGAPVVLATFYNFAPVMVNRAFPDVWTRATPEQVLTARAEGAIATLTGLLPSFSSTDAAEAASLLETAVASLEPGGRVLGAANAGLPVHDHPMGRLWQAATTVREHRGDGHVAALVAAGVGPLEVLALRCGIDLDRALMQPVRGWTDEEWSAAEQRLVERGLLASDGRATPAGVELKQAVEDATDRAASAAVHALGPDGLARLTELVTPLAAASLEILPAGDPIGLKPRAA